MTADATEEERGELEDRKKRDFSLDDLCPKWMSRLPPSVHGGGGHPASLCMCVSVWVGESFFKRVHDVRYKITDTPRLEMETCSEQECRALGCHKPRIQNKPETSSRASSFLPNSPVWQLQAGS